MNMGERPPVTEGSLLQEPTGFIPTITAQFKRDFDVDVEEGVYKAVCKLDIKVDKQELMKLLRGDRKSYDKGYKDGMRDAEIMRCVSCKRDTEKKIVRCENCKYGEECAVVDPISGIKFPAYHCAHDERRADTEIYPPEWFCAGGEPKEVSE